MAKTLVAVRVEDEQLEQLDVVVARSAGDRSDHIREALRRYLLTQSTPDLALLSTLGEFVDVQSEA